MTSPKYVPAILAILFNQVACSSDTGSDADALPAPPAIGELILPSASGTDGAAQGGDMPAGTGATPSGSTPTGSVILPDQTLDNGGLVDIAGETAKAVEPMVCESDSTPTTIQGVVLAFAFDVSGSMGAKSAMQPYNDKALKWDPIVAATKAFFADPTSEGVSATLTFFPSDAAQLTGEGFGGGTPTTMDPATPADPNAPMMPAAPAAGAGFGGGGFGGGGFGGGGEVCTVAEYSDPQVPLTELPSEAFAAAIDAVTPADETMWRIGTPTLPALQGIIEQVQALRDADTAKKNKYVIVMVTDGEPALCDNSNVDAVAAEAATVAADIPVYVIGVANPVTPEEPNPPDSVGKLNTIAVGGGTESAFIVNTDDPATTTAGFLEVIKKIRESSFSCTLPLPEPPEGKTFDPDKVNVNYTNRVDANGDGTIDEMTEVGQTALVYDEECTQDYAWRYDNKDAPTLIEMCGKACDAIKADYKNDGQLNIELGCVHRLATQK